MATLILEHEGTRKAAMLNGRVVIGRRANSHIVVADRTVSRIHAWIGRNPAGYFVVDSGSRVGTLVNGQSLKGRHNLADGDQIQVGPALITFLSNGTIPTDTEELDLSAPASSGDDGIFLDCSCGAPLWAPWDFAGRLGQCRYCGQMVELPPRAGGAGPSDPSADTIYPGAPATSAPTSPKYRGISISPRHEPAARIKPSKFDAPVLAAPPPAADPTPDPSSPPPPEPQPASAPTQTLVLCGACQSEIGHDEPIHACPECGVKFHADCWIENRGCSSYGCTQVGALDPKPAEVAHFELEAPDPNELEFEPLTPPPPPSMPKIEWDYLSLPLALAAALLGLMTFGLPPLMTGIVLYLHKRRATLTHPRMLTASIVICVGGLWVGLVLSWYWWLSGTVI